MSMKSDEDNEPIVNQLSLKFKKNRITHVLRVLNMVTGVCSSHVPLVRFNTGRPSGWSDLRPTRLLIDFFFLSSFLFSFAVCFVCSERLVKTLGEQLSGSRWVALRRSVGVEGG